MLAKLVENRTNRIVGLRLLCVTRECDKRKLAEFHAVGCIGVVFCFTFERRFV